MITLLHSDCADAHNLVPRYDALITDPPYNISRHTGFAGMKGGRGGQVGMDFGEWDKDADITGWIEPALQNLKAGGNIVIFNDWKNLGKISDVLIGLKCSVKRCLVWRKTNPTPFNRDRLFVNSIELAVWAVKKGNWTFNRLKSNFETGVFDYPSNSRNEHPTQKSLALAKEIISILTNENDLIYDPFAGSGTFGIAARELNRSYFGVEKDVKYYELASSKLHLTQRGLDKWIT